MVKDELTPVKLTKYSLRHALKAKLKHSSGRGDLKISEAAAVASDELPNLPNEERAGYPLVFPKGSVDPNKWKTSNGVAIEVDFSRPAWLPDSWGMGVKQTRATAASKSGKGGTLPVMISPDGKVFYHRTPAEKYWGKPFTREDAWGGQVRLAKVQARQTLQLIRKQASSGDGLDSDEHLFKLLSAEERQCLPSVEDFHFGVVSARRANKFDGMKDIFMVQTQCTEAGVMPTWYVDEESLQDYQSLGLTAVVGGKLCPARNKVLIDASAQGKICVELSDDISAWEYREGNRAVVRTDDAMNAAHAAAERIIMSPVAAARFMVAKMRATPGEKKPKLAGVYMLGSCARTFAGEPFSRLAFCIGAFFVVDVGSEVRFDENMKLKEDYDFTCAHIKEHGSVLRCNRLTLTVKHYSNSGGAVTNRDAKGMEERRNVAILNEKWPGCFRPNPKRENEVILKWKDAPVDDADDDADESEVTPMKKAAKADKALTVKKAIVKRAKANVVKDQEAAPSATVAAAAAGTKKTKITKASAAKASATKASATKASTTKAIATKVKKVIVKSKQALAVKKANEKSTKANVEKAANLPAPSMTLEGTTSEATVEYIRSRCKRISGQTVESVLGKLHYANAAGKQKVYSVQDLRYDLMRGFLAAKSGA